MYITYIDMYIYIKNIYKKNIYNIYIYMYETLNF